MIRYFPTLVMLVALTGCASLTRPGAPFYQSGQERKLAGAVALLERKDLSAATEQLRAICADPGVPGVTDEALFRLGLLHLAAGRDATDEGLARRALERLRKEYPSSSWTSLATAVTATLDALDAGAAASRTGDEQRYQIRRLKEQLATLSRENRDLRQSIEKLKALEIELGKGTKH